MNADSRFPPALIALLRQAVATVQRLLLLSANLPLLNVEAIIAALGVECRLVPTGRPLARP